MLIIIMCICDWQLIFIKETQTCHRIYLVNPVSSSIMNKTDRLVYYICKGLISSLSIVL